MRRLSTFIVALLALLMPLGVPIAAPIGGALVPVLFTAPCVPVVSGPPTGGLFNVNTITGWSPVAGTIGPEVYKSADCARFVASYTPNSTVTFHDATQTMGVALIATNYVASVYVKQVSGSPIHTQLAIYNNAFTSSAAIVADMTTCVKDFDYITGTFVIVSSTSTAIGGGWCRLVLTFTAIVSPDSVFNIGVFDGAFAAWGGNGQTIIAWGVDFR